MSDLLGAAVPATTLLVVVIWDLLRAHGRILRRLEQIDPQVQTPHD